LSDTSVSVGGGVRVIPRTGVSVYDDAVEWLRRTVAVGSCTTVTVTVQQRVGASAVAKGVVSPDGTLPQLDKANARIRIQIRGQRIILSASWLAIPARMIVVVGETRPEHLQAGVILKHDNI
jgi:hypothetical protein